MTPTIFLFFSRGWEWDAALWNHFGSVWLCTIQQGSDLFFLCKSDCERFNPVRHFIRAHKTSCACVYVCLIYARESASLVGAAAPNCHQWIISLLLGQRCLIAILLCLPCSWCCCGFFSVAFGLLTNVTACVCVCITGRHAGDGRGRRQWHGQMPLRPQARQRCSVCR